MRINNNIMALNTHRQFSVNNENVSKATEKLSSGFRINRAGDDAAGLAISEKMRAQIRGLEMAAKNSQDAISLVQTAEGALTETHAILQSMRELAVQASSDTNENLVDRAALDAVFQQLKEEIDDIASQTKFNDMHLLDGSFGSELGAVKRADVATDIFSIEDLAAVKTTSAATGDVFDFVTVPANTGDGFTLDEGKYSFTDGGAYEGYDQHLSHLDLDSLAAGDVIVFQHRPTLGEDNEVAGQEFVGYAVIKQDDSNIDAALEKLGLAFDFVDGAETNTAPTAALLGGKQIVVGEVPGAGGQIQTGANEGDNLKIEISDMSAKALGLTEVAGNENSSNVNITGRADAEKAVTAVNDAINKVSTQRANLGAYQNRLEHKINNLNTSAENLQAAESRIRDLDIAKEMTAFTRNSILVQSSTAMLAQANSAPQAVLSLLR